MITITSSQLPFHQTKNKHSKLRSISLHFYALPPIMSTKIHLSSSSPEPPPPPIPTAKGSRSAADPIFSDYVDRSKEIPELTLPEHVNRSILVDIDFRSLIAREGGSVSRLLRSAREFGVFRIRGHGIPAEELRSTFTEAEWVFESMLDCCRRYGDREEFIWCRSDEAMAERAQEVIGAKKYRSFSQKIEEVASKLEAIAEELAEIILKNTGNQSPKKIQPTESTLSLHRHNHNTLNNHNPHLSDDQIRQDSCKYALSLNLPVGQGEFLLQSKRSPLPFNISPETIVVTIGQQLEEWSHGELKSAYGKLNFKPDLQGSQPSFAFELKCSPSNVNQIVKCNINKTISIIDQILILLILAFLNKIFTFISF